MSTVFQSAFLPTWLVNPNDFFCFSGILIDRLGFIASMWHDWLFITPVVIGSIGSDGRKEGDANWIEGDETGGNRMRGRIMSNRRCLMWKCGWIGQDLQLYLLQLVQALKYEDFDEICAGLDPRSLMLSVRSFNSADSFPTTDKLPRDAIEDDRFPPSPSSALLTHQQTTNHHRRCYPLPLHSQFELIRVIWWWLVPCPQMRMRRGWGGFWIEFALIVIAGRIRTAPSRRRCRCCRLRLKCLPSATSASNRASTPSTCQLSSSSEPVPIPP